MCLCSLQVSMLMEQKLPLDGLFVFRQEANAPCLGPPWFSIRSSSLSGCCGDLESDKADGSLKQLCSETAADGCRFGFVRCSIEWSLAFESSTLPPQNVVIFVATTEKTLCPTDVLQKRLPLVSDPSIRHAGRFIYAWFVHDSSMIRVPWLIFVLDD